MYGSIKWLNVKFVFVASAYKNKNIRKTFNYKTNIYENIRFYLRYNRFFCYKILLNCVHCLE